MAAHMSAQSVRRPILAKEAHMNDEHNDDTDELTGLAGELAPADDAEPDQTIPVPKDGEVPPSGVLPPDPTGLGALA